jgi:tetratricopeptide (TPR) repeat protein
MRFCCFQRSGRRIEALTRAHARIGPLPRDRHTGQRRILVRPCRGGQKGTGGSLFYLKEYDLFIRAELLRTLERDSEALQAYRAIAGLLLHSGAPAHLRLAEIYEAQGERQKAAEHYARFAELWKDCDPELRPLVEEARRRMAK